MYELWPKGSNLAKLIRLDFMKLMKDLHINIRGRFIKFKGRFIIFKGRFVKFHERSLGQIC